MATVKATSVTLKAFVKWCCPKCNRMCTFVADHPEDETVTNCVKCGNEEAVGWHVVINQFNGE